MAGYKSKKKMAEDKIKEYPIVEKGSHLTVTTYEDGRTELEWDDEALMRDVRDAIAAHEATVLLPKLLRPFRAEIGSQV